MTSPLSRRKFLTLSAGALAVPSLTLLAPAVSASTDLLDTIDGVSGLEWLRISSLGAKFVQEHDLAGLSMAISYRGELKLRACFGVADKELGTAMRPHHRFRIASLSKPITSVTILRLMEAGRLRLDDRVFASGGQLRRFLPERVGDAINVERLESITIRNLLQHRVGGWENGTSDPMRAPQTRGMDHQQLLAWTLANRPLLADPGTGFAYSNFGYCLLGRVIESVTNQTYRAAVQELVFDPANAPGFEIGGQQVADRRSNEVLYYDPTFEPYGPDQDVSRADANGGWISSATDLLRFTQCVDGFDAPADLLSTATLRTMSTPPSSDSSYAMGWFIAPDKNRWHGGRLVGSTSHLVRSSDGHCHAVLVNTSSFDSDLGSAISRFAWDVKEAAGKWGDHDLFGLKEGFGGSLRTSNPRAQK